MDSKVYVEVGSIRLEEETDTPIMLLQQPNTNKVLPIWIGTIEAVSIAYAQEGFVHPRPQTHDLLVNIIESLNSQIIEVCITDIQDKTYFAEISLLTDDGEVKLSCRPSDAIALALRTSSKISVIWILSPSSFSVSKILETAALDNTLSVFLSGLIISSVSNSEAATSASFTF